jgi:hypothetical protein
MYFQLGNSCDLLEEELLGQADKDHSRTAGTKQGAGLADSPRVYGMIDMIRVKGLPRVKAYPTYSAGANLTADVNCTAGFLFAIIGPTYNSGKAQNQ